MKTLVFAFMLLGTATCELCQDVSKKTVYYLNKDKKTIEVRKSHLQEMIFAFQEKATSFKVKVPGYPSNINKGGSFDPESSRLLSKSQKGDYILIFDIRDNTNKLIEKPVHIKVI